MSQETEHREITTEEAIQRLKWEIIAQDWSLSIKRISLLEEAFLFLKHYYADRKAVHCILIMADSLLRYIKDKGDNIPSESIDFLKEAMAHIVNIYETEDLETEKEEHIFKITFYRFNKLKEKIKSGKSADTPPSLDQAGLFPEKEALEIQTGDGGLFDPEKIEQIKDKIYSLQAEAEPPADKNFASGYDTERMINGLWKALDKAEALTRKIRQAVLDLQALEDSRNRNQEKEESSPVKYCPPTELREIVIEGQSIYVQDSAISRISRLSSAKINRILEDRSIPIKDLASPLKKMPRQFKGILGSLSTGELKNISLPIIIPQGPELPDHPDTEANKAVIISKGNLAGILLCSEVAKKNRNMVRYRMTYDSDTICSGYTEQGDPLRVINVASVLKEDGIAIF